MTMVRIARRLAPVLAAVLLLGGCGGNDKVDNDVAFRFIQASPDAPMVNFVVDGITLRASVPYKGGSGFVIVTPRAYDFSVQAILAGGNQTIVDVPGTRLDAGQEYTVIALGKDADDTVHSLIFNNPMETIPEGNARLQLVNAAPDQPPMDAYLTAPGADLAASVPIGQITYGNQPEPRLLVEVKEGEEYVISLTPAGAPTSVLFQSQTIPLRSRDDLLLVAVANTATGPSPVSLVIDNHFAARQDNVLPELMDKGTLADVRVIHLSPDAPAINVVGDPATEGAADVTFAANLGYLGDTGYVAATPGAYAFRGVLSSDPAPATPPFSFTQTLGVGQRTTVLATGLLAGISGTVLVDDIRPVYAQGKIRIIDAAPGAPALVDAYILKQGTDVASVDPTLRNLGLRGATGHLGFIPDAYTVTFTEAGSKTVVAATDVVAGSGTAQTVILRDTVRADETSDGKPAGIMLVNDLAD